MSTSFTSKLTIGIDFGGVLSIHDRDHKSDTDAVGAVGEHKNTLLNMPHALSVLEELKPYHNLVLISFCGQKRAVETYNSLNESVSHLFNQMFFTKDKMFKKDVCDAAGCDVMIDDTLAILIDIRKSNDNITLIWFVDPEEINTDSRNICKKQNILQMDSWLSIGKLLPTISTGKINSKVDLSKKIYNIPTSALTKEETSFKDVEPHIVYYVSEYELQKDEENAGFDLVSNEDRFVEVGTRPHPIQTDLVTAFHHSQVGMIKSRSGLACSGLDACGGVVDSGYRKNWGVILDNARCVKHLQDLNNPESKKGFQIKKGDRVAQVVFLPNINVTPIRLNSLEELVSKYPSKRGQLGFGSSGLTTVPKQ
jgi:dUTPase